MLQVSRLKVFVEVAKQGSISAAAEELSYTQSAVSQQIAALEAETGVTLIERLPRGI
jgi:DNA-binding transcriptional LysR family regulator